MSPGCQTEEEKAASFKSMELKVKTKTHGMDSVEFRKRGKEMVDYIADYLDTISKRRVTPIIEPGYLRKLIPYGPPEVGEEWDDIMGDVDRYIMPGMTHWQHPRFHAYFPAGNSYPSILADMLSDGLGCVGFSWAANPACTELENIMMDWLGKMLGLPEDFLTLSEESSGGGVLQGSASDCLLLVLLAARHAIIQTLRKQGNEEEEGILLSKLTAYCSKEAHCCVQKAAKIAIVNLRQLDTDDNFQLQADTLAQAMEEDRAMGFIPFFVSTTLGTTSCCAFDPLHEIGPVCQKGNVWLHVDGAYAGSALICPEFQHFARGIEYAMSFNMNPNKWMLVNFDCSALWVKDKFKLTEALVVDASYLKHSYSDKCIDHRHWGIPLSRRFRSLKLWFVIRKYGVEGLQKYIREHVRLAKKFESLVRNDDRFEVASPVHVGLVCFRLKGPNDTSKKLLTAINASGELHMVPASLNDRYVIRFCVCAEHATDDDITHAWDVITKYSSKLEANEEESEEEEVDETDETKEKKENAEESADEVGSLEPKKKKPSVKERRNFGFFVRMVSDPILYNPKIVQAMYKWHSLANQRLRLLDSSHQNKNDTGIITPE